jgi:hypothetical protein
MADLRLVSEQSEEDIRKAEAEHALRQPVRELAANVLRVVRGAGDPARLSGQMCDCLDGFQRYRHTFGVWPASWTLGEILQFPSEFQETLEKFDHDSPELQRWAKNGKLDQLFAKDAIGKAALQIIAARLLGQKLQIAAGESQLSGAVRAFEEANERYRASLKVSISDRAGPAIKRQCKRATRKDKQPGRPS